MMEDPLKLSHHQHHPGNTNSSLKGKSQPGTPNKTVNFKISPVCEKEREKFLTAKYGAHQMALIRKRLKVEMWMYDHLQKLFSSEVGYGSVNGLNLPTILTIRHEIIISSKIKVSFTLLNVVSVTKQLLIFFVSFPFIYLSINSIV